jgi:lysozyme family protein
MPEYPEAFKTALKFTLKWEAGVGDPRDLAGTVNYGITQGSYDNYLRNKNLTSKSVLQITQPEVEELYYLQYWKPCLADSMVLPLAVAHFDTAVNFSVKGSLEFLQEAIGGLTVDGNFGSKSKAALEKANNLQTAQRYCQSRIDYRYQRVKANPSQQMFLNGWLRRDQDLLRYVNELGGVTTPQPTPQPTTQPAPKPVSQAEILSKIELAIRLLQEAVDLLKKQ